MKNTIAPLASLPGVTLAMLVSQDGVPIVVRGDHRQDSSDSLREATLEDADALAALAASWIADLTRAAAPISWSAPRYLVLRAARGSLLAMQVPRALLIVLLGSGMRPTDYRLAMESAAARMERGLRAGAQRTEAAAAAAAERSAAAGAEAPLAPESASNTEPFGIFPGRLMTSGPEVGMNENTRKDGASQPHGPTGE